ncbi:MAG TPA: DUF3460 family protein [Casimicrobiaceae bacterium]|nr:DUF3460 family protein [Casimicrobiaceae bacterium]
MLPARDYESEHTRFIRELLQKRPEIVAEQKKGRAIWWDKAPDEVEQRRDMDRARVPQKPYVYGSE